MFIDFLYLKEFINCNKAIAAEVLKWKKRLFILSSSAIVEIQKILHILLSRKLHKY